MKRLNLARDGAEEQRLKRQRTRSTYLSLQGTETTSWSQYLLSQVPSVLLPWKESPKKSVLTPPYPTRLSLSTHAADDFNFSKKSGDYATPVSAKPSHVLSYHDDLSSCASEDTDAVQSPPVFGLGNGPRLRTLKKVARSPSRALIQLLKRESRSLPDPQYMQVRQNGHFKASRRLGTCDFPRPD